MNFRWNKPYRLSECSACVAVLVLGSAGLVHLLRSTRCWTRRTPRHKLTCMRSLDEWGRTAGTWYRLLWVVFLHNVSTFIVCDCCEWSFCTTFPHLLYVTVVVVFLHNIYRTYISDKRTQWLTICVVSPGHLCTVLYVNCCFLLLYSNFILFFDSRYVILYITHQY